MTEQIVGKCSKCGGVVYQEPAIYLTNPIIEPHAYCKKCGSHGKRYDVQSTLILGVKE